MFEGDDIYNYSSGLQYIYNYVETYIKLPSGGVRGEDTLPQDFGVYVYSVARSPEGSRRAAGGRFSSTYV